MSNEKSRRLGRQTGSHTVKFPSVSRLEIDVVADREFIRKACRGSTNSEIAAEFFVYLLTFRSDPQVIDALDERVSLGKRAVIENMKRLASRYRDAAELRELFGLHW